MTVKPSVVKDQVVAQRVLSDRRLVAFSANGYFERLRTVGGKDFSLLTEVVSATLSFMEGAEHRHLKGLALHAIHQACTEAYPTQLKRSAEKRLLPLRSRDRFNAISELCDPLYIDTIQGILGLAIEEPEGFLASIDGAALITEPLLSMRQLIQVQSSFSILLAMLERQREFLPGSILERLSGSATHVSPRVLAILMVNLIVAARTTSETLANLLLTNALTNSIPHDTLADPTWIEQHVDGIVRCCASTEYLTRVASQDLEFEHFTLRKGDQVLVHVPSANLDPVYYPQGELKYLSQCPASKHIGFGGGTHRCPGATLALQTLRTAIPCIFRSLPPFGVDEHSIAYKRSTFARRLAQFDLLLTKPARVI